MATKKKSTPKKKTATKKKTTTKKQSFSLWGFVMKWGTVCALWGIILVGLLLAWYAKDLPDITRNAEFNKRPAITVKAANNDVAARYGELQGTSVTTEDIPIHLVNAVLATEDRRFYYHFGLDPIGLTRAIIVNLQKGHVAQGGSTITQQLAKNLFLNRERTLKRKIQEAMLAIWLEYELTKDQILSAYLNRVYLGSGAYGVDAAAEIYYKKTAAELTLKESATLAGLLKAPSKYSPLNNPQLAEERANVVLNSMVDAGYISQDEADGITKAPPRPRSKPTGGNAVRYYTDWIVDGLGDLVGTPENDLIVKTTLDLKIQKAAEKALAQSLRENGEKHNISQGAILVMRPDGAVLAMVGGKNYSGSQFNRATQAKRSPGSSFKPFVYLTAYQQGWKPDDMILDAPIEEGKYKPKNYKNMYYGEVTLTDALTHSMNTAVVRLMEQTTKDAVAKTARSLGIITPMNDVTLSLALGSVGISMLEMTTAYATIANGGLKVFPYAIKEIRDSDGELYYKRRRNKLHQRVVDRDHIDMVTGSMMSVVENGTGRGAYPGFPVAGKTGTSQDSRDAWFVGFSDELIIAVWVGNDDNSPMKRVTGGSVPARIWGNVMRNTKGRYASVSKLNMIEKPNNKFEELLGSWGWQGRNTDGILGQRRSTHNETKDSGYSRIRESGRYNE